MWIVRFNPCNNVSIDNNTPTSCASGCVQRRRHETWDRHCLKRVVVCVIAAVGIEVPLNRVIGLFYRSASGSGHADQACPTEEAVCSFRAQAPYGIGLSASIVVSYSHATKTPGH